MPKNSKICPQCGNHFFAPPSSKKITCSRECATERKRISHAGKSNRWNDAARKKLSGKGQGENLKKGTPAARISERSGPFITNINAKLWTVLDPNGATYRVRNLALFCRENAAKFAPHGHRNAYAGLRAVQAWLTGKRSRQVSQWRGWTLKAPAETIDP
jgi:hypothetical protein